MTKLCICSDSHGSGLLGMILQRERPNGFLFLGDGERDIFSLEILPGMLFAAVSGNCDIMGTYPNERLLTIEGKRLLMTHGHRYQVKKGLDLLQYRAQEEEADIIIYGHTHRPYASKINGRLYLNPGATNGGCYLTLLLDKERVEYVHMRL